VVRLRLVNRPLLARYVAPAAFLLAVTGIVLLVRSTLRPDKPAVVTTTARVTSAPAPVVTRPHAPPAPKRYYVIRSGDTLDAIAAHYGTTVDKLLLLNPGVQPTALVPGQRIRIP
jgi:LysM repeat protein